MNTWLCTQVTDYFDAREVFDLIRSIRGEERMTLRRCSCGFFIKFFNNIKKSSSS